MVFIKFGGPTWT